MVASRTLAALEHRRRATTRPAPTAASRATLGIRDGAVPTHWGGPLPDAVGLLGLQRTLGNRAVQRLLDSAARTAGLAVQRQVVDDALKGELTPEEIEFFETRPKVAEAEAKLQELMAGEGRTQGPVKYELGLIYKGGALQKVLRGNAASASANAAVNIPKGSLEAAGGGTDLLLTHNHPGGAPLSRGDVLLAVGRGLQEIRAIGRYGAFAVRRKTDAWGKVDSGAVFDAYAKGEQKWASVCPEIHRNLRPREQVPDVGSTFAADNFMAKHYACVILRDKFTGVVEYDHPNEATLIEARLNLYEAREARPDDMRAGYRFAQDLPQAHKTSKETGNETRSRKVLEL